VAFPTNNEINDASVIARDPATQAVYKNVKGTVWLVVPTRQRPVNQGPYERFMQKFKAGKYAKRIKLVKEGVSSAMYTLLAERRARKGK